MTHPGQWGLFAWQAGWVFTLRSLDLMARPDGAGAELTRMALEKQKAFADGMLAAGQAALRGAGPEAVMAAAARPARPAGLGQSEDAAAQGLRGLRAG